MTDREIMQQALDALESCDWNHRHMGGSQYFDEEKVDEVITALRSRLEQPEQEPVAIYQYQLANGSWIDQEKDSYDYNIKRRQAAVRVVYTSHQATNCAGCGKHKHTPLRIDAMGGYVCLTCIDQKLGSLLGEFGYPEPEQPAAWVGRVRGVRVDGHNVVISTKNNDTARQLCGELLREKNGGAA